MLRLISMLVSFALACSAMATPGIRFLFGVCSTGFSPECTIATLLERTLEPSTFDAVIHTTRVDSVVVHLYTTSSNERFGNITVLYAGCDS